MDEKIFDKFSESAKNILIASQQIAESMQSPLGSEHVLIALITNRGTFANEILREYDINLDQIKLILSLQKSVPKMIISDLSDEVRMLMIEATKIATEHNHPTVDAEHLLLAMVNTPELLAHQIIERIGVNPDHLRKQIESIFHEIAEVDKLIRNEEKQERKSTKRTKPKTPALDYFTVDLTHQALQNKLDPVIGREQEIDKTIQILARRTKNNPILIGEPGVGKTAIVEGLAQRIVHGKVPANLLHKRLVALDLTLLVAGTMYRGQFEDRVKKIMDELKNNPDIILFIDELHTIVGAGSAEGSLDAANILKPALAKGWVRLIGATTHDEYRKHIKKDSAFERRLQSVQVDEPSEAQTIAILKGLRRSYEKHHGVTVTDKAIEAAVKLSARYVNDRFLPDKAIDLIDEAGAATCLTKDVGSAELGIQKKIARLQREKDIAVNDENYDRASTLKDQIATLHAELQLLLQTNSKNTPPVIDEVTIAELLSKSTGLPVTDLIGTEKVRYRNLESTLKKHIIGQNEAITAISQAIKRSRTNIADPNRPMGSFMFLGPTGVGKTELARVLAKEVFGSEKHLIKVDMSDLMERHNTSRLVGAPAGYVGYDDGGQLTEKVRRKPYSVILFDEIEKAHPEVFNMFLQILEEGQLTDAKGDIINFRNTIIILTSNLGMAELTRQSALGFQAASTDEEATAKRRYEEIKQGVTKLLKDHFRPEFLNRLDQTIIFQPLGKTELESIITLQLKKLSERIARLGFKLELSPKAVSELARLGYDPAYGARPLRRAIATHVEAPLADHLLAHDIEPGTVLTIDVKPKGMTIQTKSTLKKATSKTKPRTTTKAA